MDFKESKLENFKKTIKNKKIAVLGVGISNVPAIEYLVNIGAVVTAHDKNKEIINTCKTLKDLGVKFVLGENYLSNLNEYDYILRSPGIKPFLPEVEEAVLSGVKLLSEIELLVELCPCKIVGVTGSDGKTTTTTLIAKFLEKAGYKVWLGGNIGIPLFSKLDEILETDIVVIELSSFQLMTMKKSPNISVITNISPNHLDYHRDFNEYIRAKANIFLHQNQDDIIVLNNDNGYTEKYLDIIDSQKLPVAKRFFSVVDELKQGVYLKNGYIISSIGSKEEVVCQISRVKLVGIHNLANICAACAAVIHLTGIEPIKAIITSFYGVEHRMEYVKTVNGVKWYNDSIGTSPARTIAGLKSFNQKVILIAGGYDKNIPYDELGKYILDKVKLLILVGNTANKIKKSVLDEIDRQKLPINSCDIVVCSSLEECVEYAKNKSVENDIVVLSPASASFDMYKNFEERGDHFKKLVNELSLDEVEI